MGYCKYCLKDYVGLPASGTCDTCKEWVHYLHVLDNCVSEGLMALRAIIRNPLMAQERNRDDLARFKKMRVLFLEYLELKED